LAGAHGLGVGSDGGGGLGGADDFHALHCAKSAPGATASLDLGKVWLLKINTKISKNMVGNFRNCPFLAMSRLFS
jgi:hypothetical protein